MIIDVVQTETHFVVKDDVTGDHYYGIEENSLETDQEAISYHLTHQENQNNSETMLSNSKFSKKAEIKALCNNLIEAYYPTYKQININELQGYTEADKTAMWAFINAKRDRSNVLESEIEELTTIEAVKNYEISF